MNYQEANRAISRIRHRAKALGFQVQVTKCRRLDSCQLCNPTLLFKFGSVGTRYHVAIAGNSIRKNMILNEAEQFLKDWKTEHGCGGEQNEESEDGGSVEEARNLSR